MLISLSYAADLTGKAHRTVKRYAEALPIVKEGRSHMVESRDLLPLLFGVQASDGEKLDLSQERARLAKMQADKAAIELQKLRGEVVDIEEATQEIGEAFAHVRAKLLALPSKMTPLVYSLSTHAEIQEALRESIYEALDELAHGLSGDDASPREMAERLEE